MDFFSYWSDEYERIKALLHYGKADSAEQAINQTDCLEVFANRVYAAFEMLEERINKLDKILECEEKETLESLKVRTQQFEVL